MLYYENEHGRLYHGDCLDVLKTIEDNSVVSCITDPPYALDMMGKAWDKVLPSIEIWKEVYRVLKPGAFCLVFGGTRTYHRLACSVEDAGFKIVDCMMWNYGGGFPKAFDISKGIDKEKGIKHPTNLPLSENRSMGGANYSRNKMDVVSEEAKKWQGYKTALKPAYEPILVSIKPVEKNYVYNALTYGVAGLNIEGGKIGQETIPAQNRGEAVNTAFASGGHTPEHQGRFPANFILQHRPECVYQGTKKIKGAKGEADYTPSEKGNPVSLPRNVKTGAHHADENGLETVEDWVCHPDCPVKILDEQSGYSESKSMLHEPDKGGTGKTLTFAHKESEIRGHDDAGGASRFFYTAKASVAERNLGCEDLYWIREKNGYRMVEFDEWFRSPVEKRLQGNVHPTVKPVKILEYLAKLTRMPDGGVVLDPFAGSSSTALACIKTDRPFIMVERDETSCEISKRRIERQSARHSVESVEQMNLWEMSDLPEEDAKELAEEFGVKEMKEWTLYDCISEGE